MSSKIYFKLEVLCTFQQSFDLFPLNQKGEEGLRLHLTANQGMTKVWISFSASMPHPGKWCASLPGGRHSCLVIQIHFSGWFWNWTIWEEMTQRITSLENYRSEEVASRCSQWAGKAWRKCNAKDVFHFSPQSTWQLPWYFDFPNIGKKSSQGFMQEWEVPAALQFPGG